MEATIAGETVVVEDRREAFELAQAFEADWLEVSFFHPVIGKTKREQYERYEDGFWYGLSEARPPVRVKHEGPNAGRIIRHPKTNATIYPPKIPTRKGE